MDTVFFINLFDFSSSTYKETPIGICSLSEVLKRSGICRSEICDFNKLYYAGALKDKGSLTSNIRDMALFLINRGATIVSVYTMCNNYHVALLLCKDLKDRAPEIVTILSGPHATLVASETLTEYGYIDYIGMGEGENTIVGNIQGIIENNINLFSGIAYSVDEEIVSVWDRKAHCDVDALPFVDPYLGVPGSIKGAEIEVGRGCPFRCVYCSTQYFWGNRYRIKSIERIIEEINYYQNKYGIKDFSFQHDLFTFDEKYILSFCDAISKRKMNIKWGCSSRIDTISEKMIQKMAAAGCDTIFFGIESGSEDVQRKIKKNIKIKDVIKVANQVYDNDIAPVFSFIYGFPFESDEDLNKTLCLIYELKRISKGKKATIQLWPINFLPKTSLGECYYEKLEFRGESRADFSNSKYIYEKSVQELIKSNKSVFLNYYDLPLNAGRFYECLNTTIMTLFNEAYEYIDFAIDKIVVFYNNNLLDLYKDLHTTTPNDIRRIYESYRKKDMHEYRLMRIGMLIRCLIELVQTRLCEQSLAEYLLFCLDIIDFTYSSNRSLSVTKTYQYDVVRMKTERALFDEHKETTISFKMEGNRGYIHVLSGVEREEE